MYFLAATKYYTEALLTINRLKLLFIHLKTRPLFGRFNDKILQYYSRIEFVCKGSKIKYN
jgi:hypothetical protein